MNWNLDWLFGDDWASSDFSRIKAELRSAELRTRRNRNAARRGQLELEQGLARVALVVRAMADLCIARGIFTSEQLLAQLSEADLADGVQDGGLDPKLVIPGSQRLVQLPHLDPSVVKRKSRSPEARKKKNPGRSR